MNCNLQRPRFSIITATYNSGRLFDRTAQSVKELSFRDFDDTVIRIQAHKKLIKYWISEKDSGISDAWNKGLAIARGDFILLLNAGDTYDADFLEKINALAGNCSRIVCCHARLLTDTGKRIGTIRSEPHKLYRGMHVAHNWCAVPRFYYEHLGGYANIKLAMDFEWFHRYFRNYGASGFIVLNEALGAYHLGGTSDVNYAESFQVNADILVHYGTLSPIANFWRLAYTVKHAWRARRLDGILR